MDIRKVKKLIELLEHSGIDELEIREGEESVRLARHPRPAPAPPPAAAPAGAPAEAPPAEPAARANVHEITAPMVGTFYAAPSPGARPFVEPGARIEHGDTVCIIEAMKILNQIEADCTGTVLEVLVENGQPVEFGQPLFLVDTAD